MTTKKDDDPERKDDRIHHLPFLMLITNNAGPALSGSKQDRAPKKRELNRLLKQFRKCMNGIATEATTVGDVDELRSRFQKFAECVEMPPQSRDMAVNYFDAIEEVCSDNVSFPTEHRNSYNDDDDDDDDAEHDDDETGDNADIDQSDAPSEPCVEWRYSRSPLFSKQLLYLLWGGCESEIHLGWLRENHPKVAGRFVQRQHTAPEENGKVDTMIGPLTSSCDCSTCHRPRRLECAFEPVEFALASEFAESFVTTEFVKRTVCHRTVRDLLLNSAIRGARFLEQREVQERTSTDPWGNPLWGVDPNDTRGDYFGDYFVFLGTTWLQNTQKNTAIVNCPNCKCLSAFVCPECKCVLPSCRECEFGGGLKQTVLADDSDTPMSYDLSTWNGDDVMNSFDGLLVTGAVIEALLNAGHTCFSFVAVRCELGGLSEELLRRVDERSRNLFRSAGGVIQNSVASNHFG